MAAMILFYITATDDNGEDLSLFVAASTAPDALRHYARWCTDNQWDPVNIRVWRLPTSATDPGVLAWYDDVLPECELQ